MTNIVPIEPIPCPAELNVLAYPQGPVARTVARSHWRRGGSLGISHDRGSARTDGRAPLWGFIRRGVRPDGQTRSRIRPPGARVACAVRRSPAIIAGYMFKTVGGGCSDRRFAGSRATDSAAMPISARTLRLPVANGPGTIPSLRYGTPGHGHDVSFGFGGLGL